MTTTSHTDSTHSGGDIDSDRLVREATAQNLLNCYLLETGDGVVAAASETPLSTSLPLESVVRCHFDAQGVTVYVPLRYASATGRHRFVFPLYYRLGPEEPVTDLDYLTIVALVTKELALSLADDPDRTVFVDRVVRSCRSVSCALEARADDWEALWGTDWTFREAEQSLVFGHGMHPTPKSHYGIERDTDTYLLVQEDSCQLSFVRVDPSVLVQGAVSERLPDSIDSATGWVKTALRTDPEVSDAFIAEHVDCDDALVPIHPWQADYLQEQPHIRSLREAGTVSFIGQVGRRFHPTASVQTLYSSDAPLMMSGSLAAEVADIKRTTDRQNLERCTVFTKLLNTEVGTALRDRFPDFDIIRDPAYLTAENGDGGVSGFEVILHENPFHGDATEHVAPVVALCQDGIDDARSRLANLIESVAARECRETEAVSEDWFRQHLAVAVRPVLWLYLEWGIGLAAHQRNIVLTIGDDGFSETARYRNTQNCYFEESQYERVEAVLSSVSDIASAPSSDAVADERVRHDAVLDNAFGVVNVFGAAGLVDECRLLEILRDELASLRAFDRSTTSILGPLLEEKTVPRKVNFLTSYHRQETQETHPTNTRAIYVDVKNPFADISEEEK